MFRFYSRYIRPVFDIAGHIETAVVLKTILWPTVTALATGTAGIFGHIPIMWVIMATAVSFAATCVGILNSSNYLERKNPAHKLQILKTLFNFDLVPAGGPNRKQRLAAKAQGGLPAVPAYRHFAKGQLGFEVWNRASFPLSVIVTSAETEIEGIKPPRAKFPKAPFIVQPGTSFWIHDDAMAMDNMDCDNLDGEMDITVKYGLPGDERFEIRHKGTVEIFMEPYGFLKGLYFHPSSSEPGTAIPSHNENR